MKQHIAPPHYVLKLVMQLGIAFIFSFTTAHTLMAQASFNYDCTTNDPNVTYSDELGNPAYNVANQTACEANSNGYWNYSEDFPNVCLQTSVCALDYHKNDAGFGLCTSCQCQDGSTEIACVLKPDLIVSPWMGQNGDQSLTIDPHTFKLLLNTTVANIGTGPFEVVRTGVYYCCPVGSEGLTGCTLLSDITVPCPEGFERKEKLQQVVYKKPPKPAVGEDWVMDYDYIDNNNMTVIFHPEHGHLHTENWFVTSLMKRPPDASAPNYNKPLDWEKMADVQKISFCIVNGKSCVCGRHYACTNLNEADALSLLDNYTGLATNIWADPNDDIWSAPDILKNKMAQFPNYMLGKHYQCEEEQHQGIAPGLMDIYGYDTPGNFIALPCDLSDGDYYVVMQVDPLNTYEEENEENNLAVVPVSINLPTTVEESNQIITDLGAIYGENSINVRWTSNNRINGIVKIESGKTLTIEHCTIEFMTPNSGIVVEKGARLFVENATLQGNECLGNVWKGILIEGNTNIAHPTDYYTNGSPHHGVAIVENSIIRNAQTALHAYDMFDVAGSIMGGGIVYAKNSQFINNRVSIQLDRFRGESGGPKYYQQSVIENNTFYNDDASLFHLAQEPFTDIALNAAGPGLTIRQNTLSAQNTLNIEDRGTGIRTVNTHLNILDNQFENILHGIDAYNLPSITRSLNIKGNTFFSTHRCLSLSGGVLATIAENSFFDIQAGSQDLNGYGIFADGVWGYDISANTFTCTFGSNTNLYNLGIITRNGTNQTSTILDNYFGGSFGIANYFEGHNSRLTVDCNVYNNNINNDWVINGYLNDQGECVIDNPLLARHNTFHTPMAGINGYNIDATNYVNPTNPTALFQYVGQPGFNPTNVIGSIFVNNSCPLLPISFENSQCSLGPDACGACDPDCWRMLLDQTTEETQIAYLQTRLLRAQLCSGREEEAKADLRTSNTTESAKLLTATYESEQKPDSAWLYLQQIPDDNADNTAFKDLYAQLLQGIEPPSGSGKAMDIQEAYLRQTALQEQIASAPIAQAINACYYGEAYYKNVKPTTTRQVMNVSCKQTLLSVFPNPAKNYVHFMMPTDGKQYHIIITNMYDKQVAVHLLENGKLVWNTDNLNRGLYFCALVKQNGEIVETHKLIIVR